MNWPWVQELEEEVQFAIPSLGAKFSVQVDLFNVIVFTRANEHVITMKCHMTKNSRWQKLSGSIDTY